LQYHLRSIALHIKLYGKRYSFDSGNGILIVFVARESAYPIISLIYCVKPAECNLKKHNNSRNKVGCTNRKIVEQLLLRNEAAVTCSKTK